MSDPNLAALAAQVVDGIVARADGANFVADITAGMVEAGKHVEDDQLFPGALQMAAEGARLPVGTTLTDVKVLPEGQDVMVTLKLAGEGTATSMGTADEMAIFVGGAVEGRRH